MGIAMTSTEGQMITFLGRTALAVGLLIAGLALWSAPAQAQATRTWISGVGDDANPCSRTAPCRTFQGAISKTAAGGEINCIDPNGAGAVTITKSITLNCRETMASILVAGTNAITINAGVNDSVVIDGLTLTGPLTNMGDNGINVIQVGSLVVRNVYIRGFTNQAINFAPTTNATLHLDNVTISETGTTGQQATGGVAVNPANGVVANVTITNTRMVNVPSVGIRTDLTGRTAGTTVRMMVDGSLISSALSGINIKAPAGNGTATVSLVETTINTASIGLFANGTGASIRVAGSEIAHVTFPLFTTNSGTIVSYGNNVLAFNTNAGTFSSSSSQQ